MPTGQLDPVLRFLRTAAGPTPPSDRQLLDRFVGQDDEAAFAALVRRHGPLVLGVCRRVLHDVHAAEDCFQATFWLLARKAGSLANPDLLGNWLHGVASRTARRARLAAARRRAREKQAGRPQTVAPAEEVVWRDLREVLDEEIARLPARYREAVVLCYLEGRTNAEAAARLGCSRGTIATRLARARARLRGRLVRRGLALSLGALSAGLSRAVGEALPGPLVQGTIRGARLGGAGTPAQVAALVEGGSAMLLSRVKVAVAAILLVVGVGSGVLKWWPLAGRPAGLGTAPGGVARAAPVPVPRRPSVAMLVAALNGNARRVRTLTCQEVTIDCRQGREAIGLHGRLAFCRPGQFRLVVQVLGQPELDVGANRYEAWCFTRRSKPTRLFRCPRRGPAVGGKWPLPFHPDWLVEVLGLAEHAPGKGYEVVERGDAVELGYKASDPQGKPVRKAIVFDRSRSRLRVAGYRVEDERGRVICRVQVLETRRDASGAVLPRRLRLEWPAERIEIRVRLDDVRVNVPLSDEQVRRLFRPPAVSE
jgi:RNA polymerase sigma factor (sigma-70 family)